MTSNEVAVGNSVRMNSTSDVQDTEEAHSNVTSIERAEGSLVSMISTSDVRDTEEDHSNVIIIGNCKEMAHEQHRWHAGHGGGPL